MNTLTVKRHKFWPCVKWSILTDIIRVHVVRNLIFRTLIPQSLFEQAWPADFEYESGSTIMSF